MLDSRSSACRIPDNDKVRDSLQVSNPPLQIVLSQALGGTVIYQKYLVFGIFTTGCPRTSPMVGYGIAATAMSNASTWRRRGLALRCRGRSAYRWRAPELERWAYP